MYDARCRCQRPPYPRSAVVPRVCCGLALLRPGLCVGAACGMSATHDALGRELERHVEVLAHGWDEYVLDSVDGTAGRE